MTRYRVYGVLVVIMMLTFSMSVFAQVQEDNLVGWWHFDNEKEETGNWGDITLRGATIEKGQLVVQSGKWAHAVDYTGPEIRELSLVTWVSLDSYSQSKGSALTLDKLSRDQFRAIVWAERQIKQWMPGSSFFHHTEDFPDAVTEDETGEQVFLVITYGDAGTTEITGYRNGESLGSFKKGAVETWTEGDAEAIWGKRHDGGNLAGPGDLNAHIEESRIYNVALTAEEVKTIYQGDLSVEPQGKLTTRWAKIKRQ